VGRGLPPTGMAEERTAVKIRFAELLSPDYEILMHNIAFA
jgi:hypothetical protein